MDTTTSWLKKQGWNGPKRQKIVYPKRPGYDHIWKIWARTQNVLPMYYQRKEEVARTPLFIGSLAVGFKTQADHNMAWHVNNVPAIRVSIHSRSTKLARKKMSDLQAFPCALGVLRGENKPCAYMIRAGPRTVLKRKMYYLCITHS